MRLLPAYRGEVWDEVTLTAGAGTMRMTIRINVHGLCKLVNLHIFKMVYIEKNENLLVTTRFVELLP